MRILFIAIALLSTQSASSQPFTNPLIIPDTLSGTTFNLDMAPSTVQFRPPQNTTTYGINADYLGPTIILRQGDNVTLNVTNSITDSTTMHWHGMHVPAEDDGGPHSIIAPSTTWTAQFDVLDEATTFWYHPHLHHKTTEHVVMGAAGILIVRDTNEAKLALPRTYGVDDFPLIIQDKMFNPPGQILIVPFGDTMLVNGTLGAFLEVPAQPVRFRLLNASAERVYQLGLSNNQYFEQIGSDGGLLEDAVADTRVRLATGERAEIVINFSGMMGDSMYLMGYNSELLGGIPGSTAGPSGAPGNPLIGDFQIMKFRVVDTTAAPVWNYASTGLNTHNIPDTAMYDAYRVKTFQPTTIPGEFVINGTPFDMSHVNDTVSLDDVEIWELRNLSNVAHPFHIHMIQFYVIEYNLAPPPTYLAGRKDVILVEPNSTVKFITRFDDFADPSIPYMYHCHILPHEDAGMMGQFIVVDSTFSAIPYVTRGTVRIHPNPVSDFLHVESEGPIEVYDVLGRLRVKEARSPVDVSELESGIYIVRVKDSVAKLIVE